MGQLSAYKLRITCEAIEPVKLGMYPGSAVRGALLEALLHQFCGNRGATSCQECPLHEMCPIAGLVAPLREQHPRGQDGPRPFVLEVAPLVWREGMARNTSPATNTDVMLQPGDCLAFELTLLGTATQYFHRVLMSLPTLEDIGIGSRLHCEGMRRGRTRVRRVDAVGLGAAAKESVYTADHRVVSLPSSKITAHDIAQRAEQLATDRLTLEFLTPTRLVGDGHLLRQPAFHPLILRLAERLEALEEAYGEEDDLDPIDVRQINYQRYLTVGALASSVQIVEEHTSWVDVPSYSSRQKRVTPIGGFIGQATYEGDLNELRDLLVWGELIHVGKDTVKGGGCYQCSQKVQEAPR